MRVYSGTSGYSYKEWKGSFYPADLAAADMLGYYGERLPAVEINNTFYRMPRRHVVESWATAVPETFRFAVKASRRITHFKRLLDTQDEVAYLLSAVSSLGDRLGTLLFQLPPQFPCDLPRLQAFLETLPAGTPAVFEFRHRSWHDDDVHDCLREHQAVLCQTDTDDTSSDTDLIATADSGYLRLRRDDYSEEQLAAWARRLVDTGWKQVFAFFKHEDGRTGPRLAARLAELVATG